MNNVNRTSTGDMLIPQDAIAPLQKIGRQLQRAGTLLSELDTLTATNLWAMASVLHEKIDLMHMAADEYVKAAILLINQEEAEPWAVAEALDDITNDLATMFTDYIEERSET